MICIHDAAMIYNIYMSVNSYQLAILESNISCLHCMVYYVVQPFSGLLGADSGQTVGRRTSSFSLATFFWFMWFHYNRYDVPFIELRIIQMYFSRYIYIKIYILYIVYV